MCHSLVIHLDSTPPNTVFLATVNRSSLAQLFGEETTGSFLDHVSSRIIEGKDVECGVEAPQCDDQSYRGAPRHPTHTAPATPL